MSAAYLSDRCGASVEIRTDTYVPCGLKNGHDGPCEPITIPEQFVADTCESSNIDGYDEGLPE